MDFSALEPRAVWQHFSSLCRTPRPSGEEQQIRQLLFDWARERGLSAEVDAVGNLLIRKAATPGYEASPGMVLQGHIDMVCQKNAGVEHNFQQDPIRPHLTDDGWMVTTDTTLGADNGIGVALALAVLESSVLCHHPPLEVLLTIEEETGMRGARSLTTGSLQGRRLLNLDTEVWGELYIGCAGGVDVDLTACVPLQPMAADWIAVEIQVQGLPGGHSGIDIHLPRGNAIKLLIQVLQELSASGLQFGLIALEGGTARNALAREAQAIVAVAAESLPILQARLIELQQSVRTDWPALAELVIGATLSAVPFQEPIADEARATLLNLLHVAPHGVRAMSEQIPGVVETSNNLGVVRLAQGKFEASFMVRSLLGSGMQALSSEICSLAALAGVAAHIGNPYPNWTPRADSPLLQLCQRVYRDLFGQEASIAVIHAGLECGVFTEVWPEMDLLSFGPNILGAHAPGERVEVASVAKAWQFLSAVLAASK